MVLAVGLLGAQAGFDADPVAAAEVMRVNFLDTGSLMLDCVRRLRAQGRGTVVVLSTVAAERARASNAIYGAAKAGLDALAQGLGDASTSGRACAHRAARIRGHADDGGTGAAAVCDYRPTPSRMRPCGARRARTHGLGTVAPAVDLCFAETHAPCVVPEAAPVTRAPVLIDAGIAVALAIVVVVLEPGFAVGLVLAVVLLGFCAVTLLFDRRRERRPRVRPGRR